MRQCVKEGQGGRGIKMWVTLGEKYGSPANVFCSHLCHCQQVISFSEGPAKDFIVLSPAWFFEKVASQLLAPTSARTDMKPLTVDEQGNPGREFLPWWEK